MDVSSLLILLLVVLITSLVVIQMRMWHEKASLPPGPPPFPIIGTLYKMKFSNVVESLMQMYKTYGDIFTIYEGNNPRVVLCGYQAVKETLIDKADEFSGRGYYPTFQDFTKGDGIAFTNGEKWKELRRFAVITLSNFGMGKRSVEERIQEEVQYLTEYIRKTKGPIDPNYCVSRSVSNVICSVVFGKRFEYQDENFQKLVQCIQDNFKIMSSTWGTLYNLYPNIMKYIPGPHQQLWKNFTSLTDFIKQKKEENMKTLDSNNPRDFIDCFMIKMEKEAKNSKTFFNETTMLKTTMMLYFAGTESTSTTLRFAFLFTMKYPSIAEKVYQEIDNVIGHRPPKYEDRIQMPYIQAFIHEVQRYADVIPLALPHELTKDTQIRHYTFQKGTVFIPFLTSVHYDKSKFNNPEHFDPNNFLDEYGKFKNNEALMPFSAGKRICLAETLATMELFLYFTTIMQNFTLKPLVPLEKLSVAPIGVGLGKIPPDYEFYLIPR